MRHHPTLADKILAHPGRAGRSSYDLTAEEVCDTSDELRDFRTLVAEGIVTKWTVGYATHRVDCDRLEKWIGQTAPVD